MRPGSASASDSGQSRTPGTAAGGVTFGSASTVAPGHLGHDERLRRHSRDEQAVHQPDRLLRGDLVQHHHHQRRQAHRLRRSAGRLLRQLRPARIHGELRPADFRRVDRLHEHHHLSAVLQRQQVAPYGGHPRRQRHEAVRRRCLSRDERPDRGAAVHRLLADRRRLELGRQQRLPRRELDEAAVYPYALTPAQVRAHYTTSDAAVNAEPGRLVHRRTAPRAACFFDASASADPDGEIVEWAWNFGDNSTGTWSHGQPQLHRPGNLRGRRLRVKDNRGATTTSTRSVDRDRASGQPAADGGVHRQLRRAGLRVRQRGQQRSGRHHRVLQLGLR